MIPNFGYTGRLAHGANAGASGSQPTGFAPSVRPADSADHPALLMKTMPPKYAPTAAQSRHAPAASPAPVKTLRLGRIKAAVWENNSDQRAFFNVTFSRTYMDEQKQFHDSDSFGRDDLLLLSKLADQAHTFICDRLSGARGDETDR